MDITFTLTSTLRPELLRPTLKSLFKMGNGLEKLRFPLRINIDSVPKSDKSDTQLSEIKSIVSKYFQPIEYFCPKTPGLARAVKNVWADISTKIVFHFEDDWKFAKPFNLRGCFDKFNIPEIKMIKFAAKQKYNPSQMKKAMKRFRKTYGLGCVMYRSDIARAIADALSVTVDLDDQFDYESDFMSKMPPIRKNECRTLPRKIKTNKDYAVVDIGIKWRRPRGLKLNKFGTWRQR